MRLFRRKPELPVKVTVLDIHPGDIVILEAQTPITDSQIAAAREAWIQKTGLPNKVVILQNVEIKVTHPR